VIPRRCLALMIPVVTVWSRPRGWPMATTHSPTSTASESPNRTWGRGLPASIFKTARSVLGSVPTTRASYRVPSASSTWTFEAPPTTWLLVRICPLGSVIIPVPSPRISRLYLRGACCGSWKKRKNGSPSKGSEGRRTSWVRVTSMWTTAGMFSLAIWMMAVLRSGGPAFWAAATPGNTTANRIIPSRVVTTRRVDFAYLGSFIVCLHT